MMSEAASRLIWIDMEMTGLSPENDRILEVAMVVTEPSLESVAQAPVLVVYQPDAVLAQMDAWNQSTHARSGLIEKVRASLLDESAVERQLLAFLSAHVPRGVSPMCGNSICQDRRFLAKSMPLLESYFHYRNLDVSTLKELAKRWHPALPKGLAKHGKHEALADIQESIEELKYYRAHFLREPTEVFSSAEASKALAQQLGKALNAIGWRATTAESCTGGQLAAAITAVPGSANWFDRGVVAYQESAKVRQLGVSAQTIAQAGVVSEAVVAEMAAGALSGADAQISAAISGVAGPTVGNAGCPVGTVCFGWATQAHVDTQTLHFEGDRETVCQRAVEMALEGLLKRVPGPR